ncbi:MAG: PD-(D/E)XK nuclease family protein, partial [Planctomycetes bacterium]|nr:PD-(D/E)XK nuclease family protein [Planctomycetota bacterium]
ILLDHEREALNEALGAMESTRTGSHGQLGSPQLVGAGTRTSSGLQHVGPLPLKRRKLLEERLLFRLAVGAARRQVILTFPRIETGTARERLPSSFLLRTVEAVTGERADFQALEKFEGFQRVPLSRWEPGGLDEAVDSLEFDLAAVTDLTARREANGILYLREVSPFFGRGLKEELMRWGKAHFTEYDGALQSPKALELVRQQHSVRGRTVSPSRLETYAGCPFGYFLQYVLGLESVEEPEKAATISALDKGSLIHEALWQFFTELKQAGKLPVKEEHESDLMRALEDRFRKYEASGLTGFWLLWQIEKERIRRDLRWFLQVEADEAEKGYVPTYFEVRYGMARRDGMESEISSELGPSLALSAATPADSNIISDFQKSGMVPGRGQQGDSVSTADSQKSEMPSRARSRASRGIIADFQKSAIMLPAHPQRQRPDEAAGGPPAIVRFRGRIDRIDLTADGKSARVIDYKTGKKPPGAGDGKFGGGTQLQLPIYLLAAQELL